MRDYNWIIQVADNHTDHLTTNITASVTRLGDLLDFGQLFKAFGTTINFPKSPTFLGNFFKGVKIFKFFLMKSFLGIFYRHLATFGDFLWSHWSHPI